LFSSQIFSKSLSHSQNIKRRNKKKEKEKRKGIKKEREREKKRYWKILEKETSSKSLSERRDEYF
jgi:hypothetical protein